MSTPLQQRMLTAAAAYTPLNTLLGASPFRWYYNTLQQGSAFPAVVVSRVSGSATYTVNARLRTGFSRYQFSIWGGQYQAGADARDAVATALVEFFDQWSGGTGIMNLSTSPPTNLSQYPNLNVMDREFVYPEKDSPLYMRFLDFLIFADDSL